MIPTKRARRNPMAEFATRTPGMPPQHEVRDLPLSLLTHNPGQFRQTFAEDSIRELADSIAEQGLIEPIVVRPVDGAFEIVAGERRYRALLLLDAEGRALPAVPVVIRNLSDTEAALIIATENLQREDFTIADEAVMYERLIAMLALDPERANRELGRRLGIAHDRVQRARRLARYPALLQRVIDGTLTLRQALAEIKEQEDVFGEEASQAEQTSGLTHGASSSTEVESSAPPDMELPPLAPSAPFSAQHVAAHERLVPAKAWEPLYGIRKSMARLWKHEPGRLVQTMPAAEVEALRVEALQAREELDRLLDALGQPVQSVD